MHITFRLLTVFLLACSAVLASESAVVNRAKTNPKDGLIYVWIPAGSYTFGCSPTDHECFNWEKHPTQVSVHGFWIGRTEVTQQAYQKVTGKNPSLYRGLRRPVDRVGWNEANQYCKAVGTPLPTELEWEYAVRGGTPSARYGPLDNIAWYDGNSAYQTHEVAQKLPNQYGLYDTLGNVWEWVQDKYEHDGGKRILRGDSFYNPTKQVRVSDRLWATPETAHRDMGIRCAGD